MDVNFWGPSAWRFLHSITFAYPECPEAAQKKDMTQFLVALAGVLPCTFCRKHYTTWLAEHPLSDVVNNWQNLSHWMVNLHNNVNKRHGKPVYPYKSAVAIYRQGECAKCETSAGSQTIILLVGCLALLAVVVGLVVYLYSVRR